MNDVVKELDCLMLGRTEPSWASRAKAEILRLEQIINALDDAFLSCDPVDMQDYYAFPPDQWERLSRLFLNRIAFDRPETKPLDATSSATKGARQ